MNRVTGPVFTPLDAFNPRLVPVNVCPGTYFLRKHPRTCRTRNIGPHRNDDLQTARGQVAGEEAEGASVSRWHMLAAASTIILSATGTPANLKGIEVRVSPAGAVSVTNGGKHISCAQLHALFRRDGISGAEEMTCADLRKASIEIDRRHAAKGSR